SWRFAKQGTNLIVQGRLLVVYGAHITATHTSSHCPGSIRGLMGTRPSDVVRVPIPRQASIESSPGRRAYSLAARRQHRSSRYASTLGTACIGGDRTQLNQAHLVYCLPSAPPQRMCCIAGSRPARSSKRASLVRLRSYAPVAGSCG